MQEAHHKDEAPMDLDDGSCEMDRPKIGRGRVRIQKNKKIN